MRLLDLCGEVFGNYKRCSVRMCGSLWSAGMIFNCSCYFCETKKLSVISLVSVQDIQVECRLLMWVPSYVSADLSWT